MRNSVLIILDMIPARRLQYFSQAKQIVTTLNSPYLWAQYYQCLATYVHDRGYYDRSLKLTDTALVFLERSEKTTDPNTRSVSASGSLNYTGGYLYRTLKI